MQVDNYHACLKSIFKPEDVYLRMKKIVFILHGKIKRQDKLIAQLKFLFGEAYQPCFYVTTHADHSVELAQHAVAEGATHIICLGGDGSLNEVVNGVLTSGQAESDISNIKIGLLPYGTGNDFARTMGVLNDGRLLKQWIDDDSYRSIDVGHTGYCDRHGKTTSRYFINITDVGIGGAIAQDLDTSSKMFGPTLTYQKAIISALLTYKNRAVKITGDTFTYTGKIMSLVVANGRFFGGGMGIAPDAKVDDKLFSVVVIGAISIFEYLQNLGNIKKSKRIEHNELQYLSVSEILIESADAEPLPIDMDGEFIGYTPIQMKVVPAAINFICAK